jgi:uncharacterized damage-inducible protein DinB
VASTIADALDQQVEPAVVELFRHNLWANLKLIDACTQLGPEQLKVSVAGTFGEVYETILHIVAAEEWYIFLLTGERPGERIASAKSTSLAELRPRAARSGERLIELARSLHPAQSVRWREGDEEISVTSGQLLTTAIYHATQHRTHVTTTLVQHGINHPQLSEWAHLIDQAGDAPPRAFKLYAD